MYSHQMELLFSTSLTDTTSGRFLLYLVFIHHSAYILRCHLVAASFASTCDHRCGTHCVVLACYYFQVVFILLLLLLFCHY
jgi:hypothetical protein